MPVHPQQPPQLSGNQKSAPYFSDKPMCGLAVTSTAASVSGGICKGSMQPKDDGSSGYGSPDSEIVDAGHVQWRLRNGV